MKQFLTNLAFWALHRALFASRTLWHDLRGQIWALDRNPDLSDAQRHAEADRWLAQTRPFDTLIAARKRLIQAAVLSIRLETYFAS